EQLAEATAQGNSQDYLFPADSVLQDYPALHVNDTIVERVMHGNAFRYDEQPTQPHSAYARIYDMRGDFLAIAAWDSEQEEWQPKKVFTNEKA
ncbi:MAG: tRNA pseudouridine(55) synthase TruB, partial [Chloroflexi bacterium]|nr:tRNA pseudouridine(55) synthase TruB [Chloroflexota bacterium]